MSTDDDALQPLRQRIDAIDQQLLKLFNERAQCALEVGEIKQGQPTEQAPVFYRPEREAQILRRLQGDNVGPLSDKDVAGLFREVISCCLNLEQPLTVAYFGPAGTYTEAAAVKQFGHFANTQPMASIDEVFREVESQAVHYGVVPVENSTEGMVNHTLDCFLSSQLRICAEVELPIHHALMRLESAEGEIREIRSHAQSLAQCRGWLDQHYPGVPRVVVASNAEAARQAAADSSVAAIAGEMAADRYKLRMLSTRIEDHPDNKTRFLVLGNQNVGPSGSDKTSILVSVRNEPGALLRVLEPFQRFDISLSRIETRPARSGDWTAEERASVKDAQLITAKPVLYVCNVDEGGLDGSSAYVASVKARAEAENAGVVIICGQVEAEISELDEEDKLAFLEDLGLEEPGLNRLARETYGLLGLKTYFTAGPKEIRAWTFKNGWLAPQCAGVIHSDFERGFIRAEVYAIPDLLEYGSEAALKGVGKLRVEGKAYEVQDGDVMHFRFNV